MDYPRGLFYSKDHIWLKIEERGALIGVTMFATPTFGEAAAIDIPFIGQELMAGEPFGTLQTDKLIRVLKMPFSGTLLELNTKLEILPQLLSTHPYGLGSVARIEVRQPIDLGNLIHADQYRKLFEG